MTSCPNCGAPIRGPECEYCGTVHVNRKDQYELLKAKTQILKDNDVIKTLYTEAIAAMRRYDIEQALKGPYGIKW